MTVAIDVQGVSKRFRLYHQKYTSLKERVVHGGHVPFEEFWALEDVSAEITAGQTVGILGRNGSGKSTLLKCIAGILQPTGGQVVVRGQLAAMLELGAGFQPELSGRDNIYLNGSLLGLSTKEIDRRFDEIVAFAELEQFIDNQVKYYSSGMYVRLGFSVAVSVEPDVLLVDEVLAVGDERFQQKCMDRIQQFQRDGRTIVVVSHSPDLMRDICDTVLVLDRGRKVTMAPAGEAIRIFRERLIESGFATAPAAPADEAEQVEGAAPVEITTRRRVVELLSASASYARQDERNYIETGEPIDFRVDFDVSTPVSGVQFKITLLNERGGIVFSSTSSGAASGMPLDVGRGCATFIFDSMVLLDGRFSVTVEARDSGGVVLDILDPGCDFEVMNPGRAVGIVGLPMRVEVLPPGSGELPRAAATAR
ncbi:MAG TPA: ABC transporter ATP-binding protein [Acidimicrobiales bacterium]|nr:ABC transporter ATP-binding protein [Acidimicrobiales bacterium]